MQPLPPRPVANRKGESAGSSAESLKGQKRANKVQRWIGMALGAGRVEYVLYFMVAVALVVALYCNTVR